MAGGNPTCIVAEETVIDMSITENNDRGDRLYEAALEGCWWKAKSILKHHKNAATEHRTEADDTILHIAVEMGHNYFVEKLLEFLPDEKVETKNNRGRTALHIAAMVGNIYAAQLLVQKRKQLLMITDNDGRSPLDIANMNVKLDVFTYLFKSAESSNLSTDFSKNVIKAITVAIFTKQYDLAETLLNKYPNAAKHDDEILMTLTISFPTDLGLTESFIYPSFNNVCKKTVVRGSLLFHYNILDKCVDDILRLVKFCNNNTTCIWLGKLSLILVVPIATLYPIYQSICLLIMVARLSFSVLYFYLWKVLAVTVSPIKNIEKKKEEYEEAKKILKLICDKMDEFRNKCYHGPLLEAVRKGAYEVVDEILFREPSNICSKNEEGYNVIQLAIINRSEKVYNLIIHHVIEHMASFRTVTDSSQNTLLHLAGRLAPSFALSRTTGAALQLQRELRWYKEVEKLMFPIVLIKVNGNSEIPAMIFTREHQDLMKQGENWMKTTAKSCSITAALIVTVVFAASITVPGGSNQEFGIPIFKKETAFSIFAIFNAFSLFTATTALLLFLSILTTRFSEKDFLVSLPRRLIWGLSMLFLSTTAMIVAFGAILFLVFCDQRPWMLAPLVGFACLPISVIVTVKLPLLLDLIQSTYVPIFGERKYLESCKTNRRKTLCKHNRLQNVQF